MENFGVFNGNSCLLAPILSFKDHETFTNNNYVFPNKQILFRDDVLPVSLHFFSNISIVDLKQVNVC